MYFKRKIESVLKKYIQVFPVVALSGPRQSGKSTLLKHLFGDYEYITFDSPRNMAFMKEDPEGFINKYNNKVIFDEVQKAPEIFNLIKLIVDQNRDQSGQFIITGSSQLQMAKSIKETLAGRIGLLTLLPFQFNEIPFEDREASQFKGCYPEVITKRHEYWDIWYDSYISTFVEKDVREMINIGDLNDFKRFILLLASRTSQILNYSTIAGEIGISSMTARRWISVLEASYIIFLLPPYYNNLGKRIIKAPKLYFWDTGLVANLVGIETKKNYEMGMMAGAIFENYVISEIKKSSIHKNDRSNFYYFRTNHGIEIDLIKECKSNLELYEIKSGMSFKPSMVKNFELFSEKENSQYLIYKGVTDFYKNIKIQNIQEFLA